MRKISRCIHLKNLRGDKDFRNITTKSQQNKSAFLGALLNDGEETQQRASHLGIGIRHSASCRPQSALQPQVDAMGECEWMTERHAVVGLMARSPIQSFLKRQRRNNV